MKTVIQINKSILNIMYNPARATMCRVYQITANFEMFMQQDSSNKLYGIWDDYVFLFKSNFKIICFFR